MDNNHILRFWCLSLVFLFIECNLVMAQKMDGFTPGSHILNGDTLLYRILFPVNFNAEKKYPVLLFLHGAAERGNDNISQLKYGSSLFLQPQIMEDFPAIVVFPQCSRGDFWARIEMVQRPGEGRAMRFAPHLDPNPSMRLVLNLLDSLLEAPYTDNDRFYAGGLSMGGMGVFELVYRRPDTFEAAFPICGGGDPETAKRLAARTRFWIFHGALDNVVPPDYSEDMVNAIEEIGGDVRFTLYPDLQHNSWDTAFSEPELLPWLFGLK
jgi:predicted peptidase